MIVIIITRIIIIITGVDICMINQLLILLQAMMFLGDLGLPPIDHVQSGNVFVVNDVCLLGGYENTLLGYKTRIYRLCKDHLSYLDVILFGKLFQLFVKSVR